MFAIGDVAAVVIAALVMVGLVIVALSVLAHKGHRVHVAVDVERDENDRSPGGET